MKVTKMKLQQLQIDPPPQDSIPNLESLSIREIAILIQKKWQNIDPYARPYLEAMKTLNTINDKFFSDSAQSIIAYFLLNAASWEDPEANKIKKYLFSII
jgi:hypothetical protein